MEKRRCISGEKRNLFLMFTNIVCKTKQFYFLPAIFKNWNYAMTSPKPYFIGLKCNKNTIESTAIWHKHGMWNKKESFRNTNENVSYGINVYLQSLNNTYSPWVGEVSNNNYHTSKQTSSSWENCPLNYYSRCRSVYRPMPKQPTSRVSITKETIHCFSKHKEIIPSTNQSHRKFVNK